MHGTTNIKCIGQFDTGIGFSQCTSVLLLRYLSSSAPYSTIYRGRYITLALTASLNHTLQNDYCQCRNSTKRR